MIVDNHGFGKKVRALCSKKNLNLHEMAKITQRPVSLLSQIETHFVINGGETECADIAVTIPPLDQTPHTH